MTLADIALIPVYIYLAITGMWILYLAGMNLKRNEHKLTLPAKLIAYPAFWFGLLCDVVFNIVLGTVFFIEPPREFLFTARCERHMHDDNWSGALARWFCKNLLDPYDPDGRHCS